MRSSLCRSRNNNPETEPLIPALHASLTSQNYGANEIYTEANNGTMRLPGISMQSPTDGSETRPQYIAALSSTLGALAMGAVLGWSSPVGLKFTQNTAYDFPVSVEQSAWVSSIINLGAAVVCFPIGLVMDAIGRKKTMLYLVIPFLLGWLLITLAQNVPMLIIGRFITGVAGGAFCITAPAYNSEIAVDSIRGSLGSYFQLMITVGILFAYVVGSYTSVLVFNILCTLLPVIFGVVFFFMPESPKYLVSKNRNDEAKDALIWLRGRNYNPDEELNRMRQASDESRNNKVSVMKALKKKPALKVLVICYALMLAQQLSGINAVIFNTGTIFDSAGASILPAIATIIIGVIQVIATFVSSLVVDKLGRRILLLLSALVMCVCSTALGVFFFLKERGESVEAISWLPLLSLSLFIIAFSLGFGPIPWMMAGELCTMEIKSFVASTAGVLNWLLAFAVTSTFSTLNSAIGPGQVFWLFAGIMVIAFLFIFFVVPETKGKSVEEVQLLLGAEVNESSNENKN